MNLKCKAGGDHKWVVTSRIRKGDKIIEIWECVNGDSSARTVKKA